MCSTSKIVLNPQLGYMVPQQLIAEDLRLIDPRISCVGFDVII